MDLAATVLVVAMVLASVAWRLLDWVWLRPRKLEKALRKQGFHGNSYRLFHGDLKDDSQMMKKAMSNSINLSSDIVPRVLPFLYQTISYHGMRSFTWFGPTPRMVIMDPDIIKHVLAKPNKFRKLDSNPLVKTFVDGLPTKEGNQWVKHRKLLNPAFHLDKLKFMLPAMHVSCMEMITKWEKMVLKDGSCELDVMPFLDILTSDVISRTAFGSNYQEGSKVFDLQKEQLRLVINSLQSIYIPGLIHLPTKKNKRIKELERTITSSLTTIIHNKMKAMETGESRNDDLLGLLLESNSNEIREGGKIVGMSNEEIIGECKLFYFAGQDTTKTLLGWTMFLLSIHQNWQARAREEVFREFGNGIPDFDHLTSLKIVTMILYEALRLYPPSVAMIRKVEQHTTFGNMTLPAGVQLLFPSIIIHRDKEVWGDDADEFKPERFCEGIIKATNNRNVFFPFGGGPRICIARNFALHEAKLAVATILQHFSFQLSSSYTHAPYVAGITLQPQFGVNLVLRKL